MIWIAGSLLYLSGGVLFVLYGLWVIGDDLSGDRARRQRRQQRKDHHRVNSDMTDSDQQDFASQIYRSGL